jgi:hypothetical protein
MVWPIVVTMTGVHRVIVVTDVAGQVIAAAANSVIGAVMLLENVSDGIVTSMTGLGNSGNGDRAHGDDRDQRCDIARLHWVPPFPGW